MRDRPITVAELEKFICTNLPKRKRTTLNCGGNLFLLLQQSGMAIFYFRMRINGIDTNFTKGSQSAYNVKKDLPFHKNGIMHLLEGSCRFHQKDQICDAV